MIWLLVKSSTLMIGDYGVGDLRVTFPYHQIPCCSNPNLAATYSACSEPLSSKRYLNYAS